MGILKERCEMCVHVQWRKYDEINAVSISNFLGSILNYSLSRTARVPVSFGVTVEFFLKCQALQVLT